MARRCVFLIFVLLGSQVVLAEPEAKAWGEDALWPSDSLPVQAFLKDHKVWLDPDLPASLRVQVESAYEFAGRLSWQQQGLPLSYLKIFSSPEPSALLAYLRARVRYLVGVGAPVTATYHDSVVYSLRPSAGLTALNVGSMLWDLQEAEPRLKFWLGRYRLPVNSTAVGLVQLYPAVHSQRPVQNFLTLIHEARHSDCTQRACGHKHVVCPADHTYSGLPLCDDGHVGAYYTTALVATALSKACTSCASSDRHLARANALWSLERVVNFDEIQSGGKALEFKTAPLILGSEARLDFSLWLLYWQRWLEKEATP